MIKGRVKSVRKGVRSVSRKVKTAQKGVKKRVRKSVESATAFKQHIRKNVATAILAAFAFIMALVWRDAIQDVVKDILAYLDVTGTTSQYKIIAALLTTIICTVGIIYFSRWSEKK